MVAKATGDVHLQDRLGGRGRIILTASRDTEYAFEGDDLSGEGRGSVFTEAFVEGIRTRGADTDGDGVISLQDIYEYVVERVRDQTPNQTPSKWGLDEQGELVIARFEPPAEAAQQAAAGRVRPPMNGEEMWRLWRRLGRAICSRMVGTSGVETGLRAIIQDEREIRARARRANR
jgi:hypothetical protein